jgi:hypothetical protein
VISITSTTPIPACSGGATRRQDRDVLAHTGVIALEGSEGRKKLRSAFGSTCNSESFTKTHHPKHA